MGGVERTVGRIDEGSVLKGIIVHHLEEAAETGKKGKSRSSSWRAAERGFLELTINPPQDLTNGFTETPLHISALLGHLEFTKALVTYKPRLPIEVDSSQNTPVHLASAEGHTEIVKELLKVNDKPCSFPNEEGKIPLHYAVMRGRLDVVKELVNAKPESLSFLDNGNTVFHLCVIHHHLETLKCLVELEVAISGKLLNFAISDEVGNTVFHLAVGSKQVEV
ncbi:ankyrin repeat-containing protein BDA1-like [Neltuma alba]|uniref:ankyrin repeat-containing protein BDA1-like n=1 Tax=Neltuma alba TaxID=207710 RepID=UPI0010A517E9|nr:ankyrin repeat-containing protein BDA1-like [Prosopis alba]